MNLSESKFVYNGGDGWNAATLIQHVKEKGLKPFDLPLIALDIGVMPFSISNVWDVAYHMKRVMNTSLKNPIIMNDTGYIIDGWHRLVKALLLEKETIKAVRFDDNPPFDFQGGNTEN